MPDLSTIPFDQLFEEAARRGLVGPPGISPGVGQKLEHEQTQPTIPASTLADIGGPLAGQIAGQALGSRLGFPGRVIGGGLGASAGQIGSNLFQGRPPLSGALREFLFGSGGEAVATGITRGIPSVFRKIVGATPGTPQAERALALSDEFGVPLSGGQVTGGAGISAIEQAPARFPLGVEGAREFGETQLLKIRQALDDIKGGSSTNRFAVGQSIGNALDAETVLARSTRDALYADATRAAGTTPIQSTNRLQAISDIIATQAPVGTPAASRLIKSASGATAGLSPDTITLLQRTGALEQTSLDFPTLRRIDLDLGDQISTLFKAGRAHEASTLITIRDAIKQDIEETAARVGGTFNDALNRANNFAANVFFPKFGDVAFAPKLLELARRAPEKVRAKLLNSDISGIQQIKDVIGADSPAFQAFQTSVIDRLSNVSFDASGNLFSPQKLITALIKPDSPLNLERLNAIFPTDTIAKITDLKDLAEILVRRSSAAFGANPSGTAGGLLSVEQLRTLLGVAGTGAALGSGVAGLTDQPVPKGAVIGAAASTLLGPPLLARFLFSPTGRTIVGQGLGAATGAIPLALRTLGQAVRTVIRAGALGLANIKQ